MKSRAGFTLLEVLITLGILAFMGILIAQSVQTAIRSKAKIQDQIDDVSGLRESMALLTRDVNLAYHHRDWEDELGKLLKKNSSTTAPTSPGQVPPQTTNPLSGPARQTERNDPTTNFIGSEEEMYFVTMNAPRMTEDQRIADYQVVGYFLKDCKSLDGKSSSKCLWRKTHPFVEKEMNKEGQDMVLLHDVSEFKLQYIAPCRSEWGTDWRSDKGGDSCTKDKFPTAVQVSITISKEKGEAKKIKKYSLQLVVPVHFANNDTSTATSTGAPGSNDPGAGAGPGVGGFGPGNTPTGGSGAGGNSGAARQ